MEVLIYIAFALITFPVIWVNGKSEHIGSVDRLIISFSLAAAWPIIWMLFIPCALIHVLFMRRTNHVCGS